jgi:membrane protease YdiL (CAAX protease family)
METGRMQSKPNWHVIIAYYFLACLWSWPLFWWRDTHSGSWKALPIPPEFQSPLIMWGPGLAAIVVFFVFPQMRSRFLSIPGSSWKRSAMCFLIPICFACIAYAMESKKFSWKLGVDLVVWGFACLGEELGWRGFLQGALRPLGRIRAYLLLSLMWTAWHFTTTWDGLISHMEILLPSLLALTFALAFLTERTGSLALATTVHAWVDLGVSPGGYFLWAALAAVPVLIWMIWEWPKPNAEPADPSPQSAAAIA